MAVLFGFMGWDLGKQLGPAKMKTQLQRQVPTIYFIEIIKSGLIWSPHCKSLSMTSNQSWRASSLSFASVFELEQRFRAKIKFM